MLRAAQDERGGWAARLPRLLRGLVGAASVGALGLFLWVALARVGYPFELEWMEGGVLDHAARVAAGEPVYVAPGLGFTPFLYTPLYYWVCAPLVLLFGAELAVLRGVSIAATLGLFGLLFAAVREATGDRLAGLAAAGLFAATYQAGGAWLDLARVDALFLLLLFAGSWLLIRSERHDLLAAACLAAAVLTKQTALIVVATLCAARVVAARGWARFRPGLAVVASLAVGVALLEWRSSGWFLFYVWELPRAHGVSPEGAAVFWREDLLATVPVALGLTLVHLAGTAWSRAGIVRWGAAIGLLGAAWGARAHAGGASNVVLPAYLLLAWMTGEALGRARRAPGAGATGSGARAAAVRSLVPALTLLQLLWLAYPPGRHLPTAADRRALTRLVERLRAIGGPVLSPAHTELARLAGAPPSAHEMAMIDVVRGGRPEVASALREDVRRAVRERRYAVVVLDDEWWDWRLASSYRPLPAPPVEDADALWTRAGRRTRPKRLWVPREPASGAPPGTDGDAPAPP